MLAASPGSKLDTVLSLSSIFREGFWLFDRWPPPQFGGAYYTLNAGIQVEKQSQTRWLGKTELIHLSIPSFYLFFNDKNRTLESRLLTDGRWYIEVS